MPKCSGKAERTATWALRSIGLVKSARRPSSTPSTSTFSRELGDRAAEGTAYGNLGNAFIRLGQYSKAVEFSTKTSTFPVSWGTGMGAYGNLGNAFFCLDQYSKAVEFHTKQLNISRELGDRAAEGTAYSNLGSAFSSLGQYSKAVEFDTKKLNISRDLGDRAGEGTAYCNLGNDFIRLNQYSIKAVEFYTKQLFISRSRWGTGLEKDVPKAKSVSRSEYAARCRAHSSE